eukprot:TRINITY_DN43628_c0_g1_i2.p1 TRINITY_DN43628_c0_g1~~TRINITY_DN43628_c0_g1_i2.p1  ORF type:complete len:175 (+),score=12.86 TRINITY_DN43628_c0_g1_i2:199-723(+)
MVQTVFLLTSMLAVGAAATCAPWKAFAPEHSAVSRKILSLAVFSMADRFCKSRVQRGGKVVNLEDSAVCAEYRMQSHLPAVSNTSYSACPGAEHAEHRFACPDEQVVWHGGRSCGEAGGSMLYSLGAAVLWRTCTWDPTDPSTPPLCNAPLFIVETLNATCAVGGECEVTSISP